MVRRCCVFQVYRALALSWDVRNLGSPSDADMSDPIKVEPIRCIPSRVSRLIFLASFSLSLIVKIPQASEIPAFGKVYKMLISLYLIR